MFSDTVRRGQMFVRWNERPMPRRHRSWGAMPVTSRFLNTTRPASGLTWPVMRLNSVVLPAPLGPMMALIEPAGTVKLTPPTAWKPSKLLRRSRTSSMRAPPAPEAGGDQRGGAREPAREDEEQRDQDDADGEAPVPGEGHDLRVQPEQHEGAEGGAVEGAHAAQQRHDQDLGGLRPVGEVWKHPPVEDAEQAAREAGEGAREDEGGELVAPHVDADELRPLGILADRRQDASERRAHDAPQDPEARADEDEGEEVEVLRCAVAGEKGPPRGEALEPGKVRVGDLRHALLTPRDLVPL